MPIRIAFVGASGTGKTFLASRVADQRGIPLQPSFARAVAEDLGFKSPYDVDQAGQRGPYQRRVLARMIAWQQDNPSFIADRSVFDVLTYTLMHADDRTYQECREAVMLGLKSGSIRYDLIVLCPIASFFKMGDDPARKLDAPYQLRYERMLEDHLHDFSIKYDDSLCKVSDLGRGPWLERFIASLRGKK